MVCCSSGVCDLSVGQRSGQRTCCIHDDDDAGNRGFEGLNASRDTRDTATWPSCDDLPGALRLLRWTAADMVPELGEQL